MSKRRQDANDEALSSLRAPWQNGPFKNQHIERHKKHVQHHGPTYILKNVCVLFMIKYGHYFLFFSKYNINQTFSKL